MKPADKMAISTDAAGQIIYPEEDGEPMGENTKHCDIIIALREGLIRFFANQENVFVAADLLWYPVEGDPRIVVAPDVMVAIGRPKERRGSYQQWKEDGIAPQFVFEYQSPANSSKQMADKLFFYSQYGVDEYICFDETENELMVYLRENGGLLPHSQRQRQSAAVAQ